MKVTKNRIRQIIREELDSLEDKEEKSRDAFDVIWTRASDGGESSMNVCMSKKEAEEFVELINTDRFDLRPGHKPIPGSAELKKCPPADPPLISESKMKITRRQLRKIISEAISGRPEDVKYHVLVPAGVPGKDEYSHGLQDQISFEVANHLGDQNELNRENIGAYIDEKEIDIDQPNTGALSKEMADVKLIHSKLSPLPGGEGMRITLRLFLNGRTLGQASGKLSGIKAGKIKGSAEHESDKELAELVATLVGR